MSDLHRSSCWLPLGYCQACEDEAQAEDDEQPSPMEPAAVEGKLHLDEETGFVVVEGFYWATQGQMNHTMARADLLAHSKDHRKYGRGLE